MGEKVWSSYPLCTELLCCPATPPFRKPIECPALWTPGVIQEELERQLDAFHVADIHHPELLDSVAIRQMQLLPDVRYEIGVDPLVISAASHVVEVIVQPMSACASRLRGLRKLA